MSVKFLVLSSIGVSQLLFLCVDIFAVVKFNAKLFHHRCIYCRDTHTVDDQSLARLLLHLYLKGK